MLSLFRLAAGALLAACMLIGFAGKAACQFEKVASLPMTVDQGRIFVTGSINGHPARFLIDTAIDSLLLPAAARAFGLFPILDPRLRTYVYLDEAKIGPVRIDDLKLGDMVLHDALLHVIGKRLDLGAGDEIAVLGRDFLRGYDVEFDPKNRLIVLYRPHDCEHSNLAFWSDRYNVLDMQRGDDLLHYRIVNYYLDINGMRGIFLAAKVNGRDVVAALDSGSAISSLSSTAAHSLGIAASGSGTLRLGDSYSLIYDRRLESWTGAVDSIALDQETISGANLLIHRFEAADELSGTNHTGTLLQGKPIFTADMILGADFLLSHRVLISYSQQKVYFSHEEGQSFGTDMPSGSP